MPRVFSRIRQRRRNLILLGLFICVLLLYVIVASIGSSSLEDDEEWYKHSRAWPHLSTQCEHDERAQREYAALTVRLKQALERLQVRYFLCYGSLWGAHRHERTLPWDRNIDVCVVYQEWLAVDERRVHSAFANAGLASYKYNARRGKYVIAYETVSAEVTLFEKVGTHMERVGWEKRLFPQLYLGYQNFPYRLVDNSKTPLPTQRFNGVDFYVPHQDLEMQKYLYPENWWKIVKPRGCI